MPNNRKETSEGERMRIGKFTLITRYHGIVTFTIEPKWTKINYTPTLPGGVGNIFEVMTASLYQHLKDNDPLNVDSFKKVLKNSDTKTGEKQDK